MSFSLTFLCRVVIEIYEIIIGWYYSLMVKFILTENSVFGNIIFLENLIFIRIVFCKHIGVRLKLCPLLFMICLW